MVVVVVVVVLVVVAVVAVVAVAVVAAVDGVVVGSGVDGVVCCSCCCWCWRCVLVRFHDLVVWLFTPVVLCASCACRFGCPLLSSLPISVPSTTRLSNIAVLALLPVPGPYLNLPPVAPQGQ